MYNMRQRNKYFTTYDTQHDEAFIIGGGPSLRGFDYALLKDKFTIGINKGFKFFTPTILLCMDVPFYEYMTRPVRKRGGDESLLKEWNACSSIKLFMEQRKPYPFTENIQLVKRCYEKCLSIDLVNRGIYFGNNTGFSSIMLCAALGFKKIYMLGIDMKIDGYKTHCHEGYINDGPFTLISKLEKYIIEFEQFASLYEEAGIEVINLGPDSALANYRKMDYKTILTNDSSLVV